MNRVDAGIPTGGQFDVSPRAEAEVELTGLSVDEAPPETLLTGHIGSDLEMSNEIATSWFSYRMEDGALKADRYNAAGDVDKTFTVNTAITQDAVTATEGKIESWESEAEGLSTDEDVPDALTLDHFASDLSLSNEYGMSWFAYRMEDGALKADLYTEEGGVIGKTFTVGIDIVED